MNKERSQEIIEVLDNFVKNEIQELVESKLKVYLDSDLGILTLFLNFGPDHDEFTIPFVELVKENDKKVVLELLKEYLEENTETKI